MTDQRKKFAESIFGVKDDRSSMRRSMFENAMIDEIKKHFGLTSQQMSIVYQVAEQKYGDSESNRLQAFYSVFSDFPSVIAVAATSKPVDLTLPRMLSSFLKTTIGKRVHTLFFEKKSLTDAVAIKWNHVRDLWGKKTCGLCVTRNPIAGKVPCLMVQSSHADFSEEEFDPVSEEWLYITPLSNYLHWLHQTTGWSPEYTMENRDE